MFWSGWRERKEKLNLLCNLYSVHEMIPMSQASQASHVALITRAKGFSEFASAEFEFCPCLDRVPESQKESTRRTAGASIASVRSTKPLLVLRTVINPHHRCSFFMRPWPSPSGDPVTHSDELCLRTPSPAYLIGAVDDWSPQSEHCTLGSVPSLLQFRTVKVQSVLWILENRCGVFTDFTNYKRMPVLAVVEVSPMRCEQIYRH